MRVPERDRQIEEERRQRDSPSGRERERGTRIERHRERGKE